MLKKIWIIFICLLMCSCSADSDKMIKKFIESEVLYFEYLNTKYEFSVHAGEFTALDGRYKGMTVLFDESGCVIRYGEFSIETQGNNMPYLKAIQQLCYAFKNNGDSAVITDDGAYALLIDSSRFLVYYNTDNEKIDKLIAETADGVFEYTVLTSEETD